MFHKDNSDFKLLCTALASTGSEHEVAALLDDLCTVQELEALSQRIQVAVLLTQGMNYAEINRKTGVSSATISRVNKCINYGSGGYKAVLAKLGETESHED